jgi:hypothetical protein
VEGKQEKPRIFPQEFDSEKILRARLCSRVRAATRITPREPDRKGQTRRERNHNNRRTVERERQRETGFNERRTDTTMSSRRRRGTTATDEEFVRKRVNNPRTTLKP